MPNPLARVLADPRRKEALIHKIVAASLNASSSKIQSKHIPRRIIIRYLNNFAFEIGCALPSPEIIRNLLKLLKGPVDEYSE